MKKLKDFLKKIFLPSFTYEFESSLPNDGYFEKIPKSVRSMDGEIVTKNSNYISFYLNASKIFSFPSFGKVLFKIESLNNKYKFYVQFFTSRKIFLFAASILSISFLVNIAVTGEINKIIVIPIIFFSGHICFFGMLPSKIKKIKDVLFSFDE